MKVFKDRLTAQRIQVVQVEKGEKNLWPTPPFSIVRAQISQTPPLRFVSSPVWSSPGEKSGLPLIPLRIHSNCCPSATRVRHIGWLAENSSFSLSYLNCKLLAWKEEAELRWKATSKLMPLTFTHCEKCGKLYRNAENTTGFIADTSILRKSKVLPMYICFNVFFLLLCIIIINMHKK